MCSQHLWFSIFSWFSRRELYLKISIYWNFSRCWVGNMSIQWPESLFPIEDRANATARGIPTVHFLPYTIKFYSQRSYNLYFTFPKVNLVTNLSGLVIATYTNIGLTIDWYIFIFASFLKLLFRQNLPLKHRPCWPRGYLIASRFKIQTRFKPGWDR